MKSLIKIAAIALTIGGASAATINVTAGLSFLGQGYSVTSNSVATTYVMAAGNWDGSTFTAFGPELLKGDSDLIAGQFAATSPTTLNNLPVHIFIGSGATVAGSTEWMILSGGKSFPSDVTSSASETVSFTVDGSAVFVASQNATLNTQNVDFSAIPEPSVALLGALGVLGLIRRRR